MDQSISENKLTLCVVSESEYKLLSAIKICHSGFLHCKHEMENLP